MDLDLDLDLELDLDLDGLTGAAASAGAGSEKPTFPLHPESRWSSTSSAEPEADNFWVCCYLDGH